MKKAAGFLLGTIATGIAAVAVTIAVKKHAIVVDEYVEYFDDELDDEFDDEFDDELDDEFDRKGEIVDVDYEEIK